MKKFISYFAYAMMAGAMLTACGDSKDEPDGPDGPDGSDPTPVVEGIEIDGDFADWDALKPEDVVVCKVAPDDDIKGLKTIKFTSDSENIYAYAEVDPEICALQNHWPDEAKMWDNPEPKPLRFMFDLDNNAETGSVTANTYLTEEVGFDALLDNYYWFDGKEVKCAWSEYWEYAEDGNEISPCGRMSQNTTLTNAIISQDACLGKFGAGCYAFEMQISRANMKIVGNKVKVLLNLLDSTWSENAGRLPQDGTLITLNLK